MIIGKYLPGSADQQAFLKDYGTKSDGAMFISVREVRGDKIVEGLDSLRIRLEIVTPKITIEEMDQIVKTKRDRELNRDMYGAGSYEDVLKTAVGITEFFNKRYEQD